MNPSDSPEPAMPAVNPITRRNFMKKTALTAGAITLLGQGVGFANPSSSKPRKVVKVRRVWQITSDGVEGTGMGSDENQSYNIAYAISLQDLLADLVANNHITKTETVNENQWVPEDWELKEVLTTADGEQPPGALEQTRDPAATFSEPFEGSPGAIHVQTWGKFPATNSTLTMRWIWGPPEV